MVVRIYKYLRVLVNSFIIGSSVFLYENISAGADLYVSALAGHTMLEKGRQTGLPLQFIRFILSEPLPAFP